MLGPLDTVVDTRHLSFLFPTPGIRLEQALRVRALSLSGEGGLPTVKVSAEPPA